MKLRILTLFPELIEQLREYGIIGRAMQNGIIELSVVNIRDYTESKHGKVDDAPYGGGAGMIMSCQPIADAVAAIPHQIACGVSVTAGPRSHQDKAGTG